MDAIGMDVLLESAVALLSEVYEGVPAGQGTWFIDGGPESGILAALDGVSAEAASREVGGTTVASEAEHLRWSLAQVNATMRGAEWNAKWSESWLVHAVDADRWVSLRENLRGEYETLRDGLRLAGSAGSPVALEGDVLTGVLALAPHAAFHYGTILQLIQRSV